MFVSLERGTQSGLGAAGIRVASGSDDWKALWSEHARLQIPQPSAPKVDFARYRAALVLAGPRPRGGHSILVERVHYSGGQVLVEARHRPAAAGRGASAGVERPDVRHRQEAG